MTNIEEEFEEFLPLPEDEPKPHAEYLETQDDFPLEEMPNEPEEWTNTDKKVNLSPALVRSIARRPSMCRILKFLHDHKKPFYTKQICHGLKMNVSTLIWNIQKLIAVGLVQCVSVAPIDLKTKYYQLTSRKAAEKILKRYRWLCGFKLSKTLPIGKTVYVDDLKENDEFLELCRKYYLVFEEAVEVLEQNKQRVESVSKYNGELVGFRRKEQ